MKTELNKELDKYFSQIKKLSPGTQKDTVRLANELRASVDDYLAENPAASITEIMSVFGTPEQISGCITVCPAEIKRRLNVKKTVLIAAAVIIFIYLAFVIISLIDVHEEAHGYLSENIAMIQNIIRGAML